MTRVTCKCGAVYERILTRLPVRDKRYANCDVCGELLESWHSSLVPSFILIRRREGVRAYNGRAAVHATAGVIYNPHNPALLAWLASLPAETEYVMRCALMTVLPSFRQNGDFRRRVKALRAQLNPDEGELAALLKRANRRAELIREHLAAG